MKKDNSPTLFDFIKQIQSKRRTYPYDKKVANAFMLSQWLSMDKTLLQRVNKINQFQFLLPDEVIYNYYMDVIPAGKRFIKFIKKRKDDDKLKNRIEKLQEQYPEMSVRECKMIISYLMNRKK
jgi:hypothetical protein